MLKTKLAFSTVPEYSQGHYMIWTADLQKCFLKSFYLFI